jgi:hypothetical protein
MTEWYIMYAVAMCAVGISYYIKHNILGWDK